MDPLISIPIPVFNAPECVAETIESALGRAWSRKEMIIVDYGSSEHALGVARKFAGQEICVVSQINQGAAAARKFPMVD